MIRRCFLIAMSTFSLAGCNAPARDTISERPGIGANGRRELIAADVDIAGEKKGKTYAAYDLFRDQQGPGLAFAGYGCESNCADIISGYRHARRDKIKDPRRCVASTWGELEGCVAFTQGFPTELSSLPPLKETVAR